MRRIDWGKTPKRATHGKQPGASISTLSGWPYVTHSERFELLMQQLREIAAKLTQTPTHAERLPLLREFRAALRKLDKLMHEDGSAPIEDLLSGFDMSDV